VAQPFGLAGINNKVGDFGAIKSPGHHAN